MYHRFTNRDMKEMAAAGSVLKPKWKEGKYDKDPPSNNKLDVKAKKAAKRLNAEAESQASLQLKATASGIAQGSILNKATGLFKSCETLACLREDARRQRFLTAKFRRLIARQELPKEWVLLSPISEAGLVEPNDLTKIGPGGGTATCRAVYEHLTSVLAEGGVRYAIGGLDIVYGVDKREQGKLGFKGANFADHWMIHMTVMLLREDYDQIKPQLREAYPATHLIDKPIKAEDWDGDPRMIAYVFKRLADNSAVICRETYLRKKEGDDAPRKDTRLVPLKAKLRNDLIVMLDQLAPDRRYLLWGLRPANGDNGLTIKRDE